MKRLLLNDKISYCVAESLSPTFPTHRGKRGCKHYVNLSSDMKSVQPLSYGQFLATARPFIGSKRNFQIYVCILWMVSLITQNNMNLVTADPPFQQNFSYTYCVLYCSYCVFVLFLLCFCIICTVFLYCLYCVFYCLYCVFVLFVLCFCIVCTVFLYFLYCVFVLFVLCFLLFVLCFCIVCIVFLYCLYCVFVLFCLRIFILICFVCTGVRTTATE